MSTYLEVAIDTAQKAGRLIKDKSKDRHRITLKGDIDIVTDVDVESEKLIVDSLKASFPEHGILAEERGEAATSSDYMWIIDPIDGTTNYAHGFPFYAVSIALEHKGDVIVGVVYDPNLDELFTAEKGMGAFLNGVRISVSNIDDLDKSLLATGFPYYYREHPEKIIKHFIGFSLKTQGIRRAGAATIDLVSLACGRFDGYWEFGLKPWDMAAGSLIAIEAGAKITRIDGGQFDIRTPEIVATNALIHDQMLEVLRNNT